MNQRAYRINGEPAESASFYALACHPDRAIVVEACAGAGKTWMLVSRMVRALLAGAAPEHILAITFTRKAAAEMRARLQQWLQEFSTMPLEQLQQELQARGMHTSEAKQQAPALQALYARLLRHGRPVQIRTFHGWFAALLQAAPIKTLQQLGLPTEYELVEDDKRIMPLVWRPFHAAILRDLQAQADYQALIDTHGRTSVRTALENALSKRTELSLADAAGTAEQSVPHFTDYCAGMQGLNHPTNWLLQREAGQALLLDAARALGGAKAPSFQELGSKLEQGVTAQDWQTVWDSLFTKNNDPRKFSDNIPELQAIRTAQDAAEQVHQALLQHAGWLHQQRMLRLSRLLCSTYAQLKQQQGWIDMNDIENAARTLLQDATLSGWLQERLDTQVRHLLIDEFQDTNPLQWQALYAWLQSYAGAGQAPSVFVVGDPKQSIYRFRRAAPEVFAAARLFVQQGLGGDVLSCDHTRRNAQPVVAAVNAVMLAAQAAGAFADFRTHTTESDAPGQVVTLPRIPRPPKDEASKQPASEAAWRNSLTTPQSSTQEPLLLQECRQAAGWLAQWLRAGLPPQEVLVLARKNEPLALMRQALADHGIHAEIAEKQTLPDYPEVQDIVALVDALVSPQHNLSLAQALKSPLFGASDDTLVDLALMARQQGDAWLHCLLQQARQPASATDAASPLAAWGVTLKRWQQWLQQLPVHDALDAIYRDGDVLPRYAAALPAARRSAALQRLRALPMQALAQDAGRYPHPYEWVRSIRNASQAERAPSEFRPQAVRLLTVHGAKGLEAALVLLIHSDATRDRARAMETLIDWPGQHPHPQQLVFLESGAVPPPSAQALFDQEQAADRRETYNAWYVAMTRASRVLALSANEPYHGNPESWWQQMQATGLAQPAPLDENQQPMLSPALSTLAEQIQAENETRQTGQAAEAPAADPQATANPAHPVLAILPAAPPCAPVPPPATTSLQHTQQATLGEAMHKALEWYRPGQPLDTPALRQTLATHYGLPAQHTTLVLQRAQAIVQGEGAWVWDEAQLQWQANEVDIAWQGQCWRIDRLVQRKAQGNTPASWWVLDFKSAFAPESHQALQQQLQAYRQAVQALHPQELVHAAFLTAEGRMVVLATK